MAPTAIDRVKQPRGNPNLNLSPRCGARTRSGCPCRAPAIHGRARCRMHGGRSTGPRTEEGLQRLRAAHTVHGHYAAPARAERRFDRVLLIRIRVLCDAVRYRAWLPAALEARLAVGPKELGPPPNPDWGTPPCVVEGRVLRGRRAERIAALAEAAALAPWRSAIATAREARRIARGGGAAAAAGGPDPHLGADDGIGQKVHAPAPRGRGFGESWPRPHAPVPHAPVPGTAASGIRGADSPGVKADALSPVGGDRARLLALVTAELMRRGEATAHAPGSPSGAPGDSADSRARLHAPVRGWPGMPDAACGQARSGGGTGLAAPRGSGSVRRAPIAHAPVAGAPAPGQLGDFGAKSPCTSVPAAPPPPAPLQCAEGENVAAPPRLNRAQRRRLKWLQRRMRRGQGA